MWALVSLHRIMSLGTSVVPIADTLCVVLQLNPDSVRSAFAAYGQVKDVHCHVDYNTKAASRFAFVTFSDTQHANEALEALHGCVVAVLLRVAAVVVPACALWSRRCACVLIT